MFPTVSLPDAFRLAIVRVSVAVRTLTGRLLPRFGFYSFTMFCIPAIANARVVFPPFASFPLLINALCISDGRFFVPVKTAMHSSYSRISINSRASFTVFYLSIDLFTKSCRVIVLYLLFSLLCNHNTLLCKDCQLFFIIFLYSAKFLCYIRLTGGE